MKVLITGHSGFLGQNVVSLFDYAGHNVYGVSRSISSENICDQYSMDITECNKLTNLIASKYIDVIVHCAGKPIVQDCSDYPFEAFRVNTLGAASILEASRKAKVKKVIIIETDKVYGDQKTDICNELSLLHPNSPYELSKSLICELCYLYRSYYNMTIIEVRPVNLFGAGDYNYTRLVPAALKAIRENKGIPLHISAKNMTRSFLYVKNAAEMLYMLAIKDCTYDTYNFSAGQEFTIPEAMEEIKSVLNYSVPNEVIGKPGEYTEIPFQSIDGSRFQKEFNFKFTPFKEAIKETYNESYI